MNTQAETLKDAIKYAEEKSEEYIKEKCANQVSFEEIKKEAWDKSKNNLMAYYNNLRNGVIKNVAEKTGDSFEKVNEDFIKKYY